MVKILGRDPQRLDDSLTRSELARAKIPAGQSGVRALMLPVKRAEKIQGAALPPISSPLHLLPDLSFPTATTQ